MIPNNNYQSSINTPIAPPISNYNNNSPAVNINEINPEFNNQVPINNNNNVALPSNYNIGGNEPYQNIMASSINLVEYYQHNLKSQSKFVKCPTCGYLALSKVKQEFSMGNCLCAYCLGALVWFIYQQCRNKDSSCYDAEHSCSNCNILLNKYNAC